MGDEALIDTVTFGPGKGGAINIETGQPTMRQGSVIDAGTSGTGQGGSITITADDILLDGSTTFETQAGLEDEPVVLLTSISTESQGEEGGQAGDILIHASQIELRAGATIAASSEGRSDAGQIVIQASETFRSQQGFVTTEAQQAGGGKITLIVGDTVQLIHSDITTTVQGGSGDAGNIILDSRFVVLNDSRVIARAVWQYPYSEQ